MQYEEALKAWGLQQLTRVYGTKHSNGRPLDFDPASVTVETFFEKGFGCCCDEGHSMAEDPRAEVRISAQSEVGKLYTVDTPIEDFSFSQMLAELLEVSDENLTR